MEKLRATVTYAFYYCFAVLCLTCIYGLATILSCLEVARVIKPIHPRPQAARSSPRTKDQVDEEIRTAA